jgi:UPF0755 protein
VRKIAALLLVLLVLGVFGDRAYEWVNWQVYTPTSTASRPVLVTIPAGASQDELATTLSGKGLIRDRNVFLNYLRWLRVRGEGLRLRAGAFELNRDMSMARIVQQLQHGAIAQVTVRMGEGDTLAAMAEEAARQGAGTAQDYRAAASDIAQWPSYAFLKDRPASAPRNLEGFLYPDTYRLVRGSPAKTLVQRQLDRFGSVFTPQMRAQAARPTDARPAESVYSIVILASIVEKEVEKNSDRGLVCDVFYNRLAQGMELGSDATVLYAVGKSSGTPTQADLQVSSPYNTRKYPGLPPGPISNPSIGAIQACLTPPKTAYLYFFTDPQGAAHYAATYDEFLRQQQQYGLAGQ